MTAHDVYFVVRGVQDLFLSPLRVAKRKHYHPGDDGDVEHVLGPEGHNKDNVELQVYLTSK